MPRRQRVVVRKGAAARAAPLGAAVARGGARVEHPDPRAVHGPGGARVVGRADDDVLVAPRLADGPLRQPADARVLAGEARHDPRRVDEDPVAVVVQRAGELHETLRPAAVPVGACLHPDGGVGAHRRRQTGKCGSELVVPWLGFITWLLLSLLGLYAVRVSRGGVEPVESAGGDGGGHGEIGW